MKVPLYSSNTVFVFASTFTTNFFPPNSMSCKSRIARRPESGLPYSQKPNAVELEDSTYYNKSHTVSSSLPINDKSI